MPALKSAALNFFHASGALHAIRWRNRRGLRILMYHRFPSTDAASFERQCAHLREHYHPLRLSEAVAYLRDRREPPPNSVVLTIDDGHRDFGAVAAPILAKYNLPATVFLVSGFLDGELWLWFDQVRWLFAQTQRESVLLNGQPPLHFQSPAERSAAARTVTRYAKTLSNDERLALVAGLPQALGIALPAQPPEEFAPLRWDDTRRLLQQGIEFGPHTVTHPILSRVIEPEALAFELNESKQRLEAELQRPAEHFCYPNGRGDDLSAEVVNAVRASGCVSAVTTEVGFNHPGADLYRIARIGMEPGSPEQYFRQQVAGFRLATA